MSSYKLGTPASNGMVVENMLNRDGDILPYGYYNPETAGKLTWMCNYGIEGTEIISVFVMTNSDGNGKVEKDIKYLKDIDEAKFCRAELVKAGWRRLTLPEIKFTVNDI